MGPMGLGGSNLLPGQNGGGMTGQLPPIGNNGLQQMPGQQQQQLQQQQQPPKHPQMLNHPPPPPQNAMSLGGPPLNLTSSFFKNPAGMMQMQALQGNIYDHHVNVNQNGLPKAGPPTGPEQLVYLNTQPHHLGMMPQNQYMANRNTAAAVSLSLIFFIFCFNFICMVSLTSFYLILFEWPIGRYSMIVCNGWFYKLNRFNFH